MQQNRYKMLRVGHLSSSEWTETFLGVIVTKHDLKCLFTVHVEKKLGYRACRLVYTSTWMLLGGREPIACSYTHNPAMLLNILQQSSTVLHQVTKCL